MYISNSFDATSHFESETENVLNLYKQISGKDLDLTNLPEDADDWAREGRESDLCGFVEFIIMVYCLVWIYEWKSDRLT